MSADQPIIWQVEIAAMAEQGGPLELVLDEAARAALARFAGVEGVLSLKAIGTLAPWGNGFEIRLRLEGAVVQACVVTLEPVEARIAEEVVRRYLPGLDPSAGADVALELGDEDPPEPLPAEAFDLGAIVAEHFVLALDPYPRAPGAVLSAEASAESGPERPFEVLKQLKDRM